MKIFTTAILLGLVSAMVASADVIKAGSKINEASATLESYGYREGGLAVVHSDQIRKILGELEKDEKDLENLKVWQVDQGFLVISYVVSTGTITNLSFNLYDERPKSLRKDFHLSVLSFDPLTDELIVKTTKKKKGEQVGSGQPATRPESNSEGGDKPQPEPEGRSR